MESCTNSTCRVGDFLALIALIALQPWQGYKAIKGTGGGYKESQNRYKFLKATRLSRRQEGWAGIGFSKNRLFPILLLSAMTRDH